VFMGRYLRRRGLLRLKVVVFGDQRNEKSQSFHIQAPKLRPAVRSLLLRRIRRFAMWAPRKAALVPISIPQLNEVPYLRKYQDAGLASSR
jgi:hypothetical protein